MVKLATCSLEGVTLPTRLTEIYKGALRLFIFKHHPEYQGKTLERSDLLSDNTFPSSVEETLSRLEVLARSGIEEKRLVFELKEVKGMENCGLLNRLPDVENAPFTYKPQFCFIHLTMQEFVAARGIAKMNPQDLQEFVSSKFRAEKWSLVIQFVAGLLRDKETIVNGLFLDDYDIWRQKRALLLMMKCSYEANSISCVKSAAAELKSNSTFSNCVNLGGINLTPVDCTAVVYFLKHIDNLEYLDVFGNQSMGDGGCSELSKLIKSGGPRGLNVGLCGVSDQGLIMVLEAMKTAETCNLSQLYVNYNVITDEGYSYLCDTLMDEKCKLTGLAIDLVENLKLSNALKHRNCKLNMLQIHSQGIMKRTYSDIISALMDENCKLTDLRFVATTLPIMPDVCSHPYEALKNKNCELKLTKLALFKMVEVEKELLLVCETLKNEHWKLTELWVVLGSKLILFDPHYLDVPENTVVLCRVGSNIPPISDLELSCLCAALKHKDCKLKKLRVQSSFLTKNGFDDLQNAIMHDNCKLEYLTLCNSPDIPEIGVETKIFVCSIMTVNGKKILAKMGDSGQYEEIVLSKLSYGMDYTMKIEI